MSPSLELEARKYPSFGECIFCGTGDDLTDEHVVPHALSGVGEVIIVKGSCTACNNQANQWLENPALQNDFLPVRHMLQLKRRRKGKKQKPATMPLVALDQRVGQIGPEGFDTALSPQDYPPNFEFSIPAPAGILSGVDRSGGVSSVQFGILRLGGRSGPPVSTTRHRHILGAPELLVAKMAYCHTVAERGLNFLDMSDLKNLLTRRREDMFNFVGQPIREERLASRKLHAFYFRERDEFVTVLVHFLASFGGPVYEVVLGRR